MNNTLKLQLDTSVYEYSIKENCNKLTIVLPISLPTKKRINDQELNKLQGSDQVVIKLYLYNEYNLNNIEIKGKSKNQKIYYSDTYDLSNLSKNSIFTFTTNDGGALWLVNVLLYSESLTPPTPKEGIQEINGKTGSSVTLTASDILVDSGNSIQTEITEIKNQLDTLSIEVSKI